MVNPLACLTNDAINNRFVAATGVITDLYFKQSVCLDPWREKFKQREFPLGQGVNPSYVKLYRNVPTEDLTMTPVGFSDCTAEPDPYSACDPGYIYIPTMGQELKQMQLYRSPNIRTPELCVIDLQLSHDPEKMIAEFVDNLVFQTSWYWNRLALKNLMDGVGNKWVVAPYSDGTLPISTTTLPAVAATQTIVQGVLDRVFEDLLFNGVGCMNPNACAQPVYDLYIGQEASRNLIRQDFGVRQDIRFSSEADVLLTSLRGMACKEYGGFKHNLVAFPPRFNFGSTGYTEVLPFDAGVPTTVGPKQTVSVAYGTALYEGCFVIPNADVMQWLVPPMNMRFGQVVFGGQGTPDYAGDFQWLNYQTDCNTDKSKGFFEGRILTGWDFPFPEYGYFIVFKRCFTPIGPAVCTVNGVPDCTVPVFPSPPTPPTPPSPYLDPCLS